jgi:predicted RNase H-like nuclease/alkylated DNA nucleotide flippase Atl1
LGRRLPQSRESGGGLGWTADCGKVAVVLYLGVDLAWGEGNEVKLANQSGVVALEPSGVILHADWTVGLDETFEWIERHATPDTLLFVDAPLIVDNAEGQRIAERQVGQRYGRWWVSANSTNTTSPRQAGVHLRERLERAGWRYDDGRQGPPDSGRVFSECYPYTTLVGVEELGYDDKRPAYKRLQKGVPAAQARDVRASACDELIRRVARLRDHEISMDLASHTATRVLVDEQSPVAPRAYKQREDLLDACICAWTAALWHRTGTDRCQLLGDENQPPHDRPVATIIAPARPEQRGTTARAQPGTPRDGRPPVRVAGAPANSADDRVPNSTAAASHAPLVKSARKLDLAAAAEFLESVPRGRWTSYGDVAVAAGRSPNAAQGIAAWIGARGHVLSNVHRVLNTSGEINAGWKPAAPGLPASAAEVETKLRSEGIRFASGRADPKQRWRPQKETD